MELVWDSSTEFKLKFTASDSSASRPRCLVGAAASTPLLRNTYIFCSIKSTMAKSNLPSLSKSKTQTCRGKFASRISTGAAKLSVPIVPPRFSMIETCPGSTERAIKSSSPSLSMSAAATFQAVPVVAPLKSCGCANPPTPSPRQTPIGLARLVKIACAITSGFPSRSRSATVP